ncbi:MAG: cystathionine gamma-synthase family protein [Lewinellaceae bacterium]|nr:cystathionine gamma-synthase family protein [Saprospiraceae bacterium]MCB9356029.1 cystathionine gamma-synthase family protein [Lewinellaceae bacterium]
MKSHKFRPESLMMSYGYKPELSEGAIKCPIFQTSTFVFKNAEEGKAYFELAYGLRAPYEAEEIGLIYSRINNPDLEILEGRISLWEEAGDCAVFESGMSAITTVLLEFLKPGDLVLCSSPVYGGTDHFIKHFLPKFGIHYLEFKPGESYDDIVEMVEKAGLGSRLAMVYVETPANPTNALIDLECVSKVAQHFSSPDKKVYVAVDNTYMGPLWQQPLRWGADFSLYSATKYLGGHSDVIAGACVGSKELIGRVKTLRTFLGNMAGPWTGWLLLRSLETLKIRMEQQARNAQKVAEYLQQHAKVEKVYYLGLLTPDDGREYETYKKQYGSPGAMLSFDIRGGEAEAFRFLNSLRMIHLAVSLGSTESLAEHPATMTHAGVHPKHKRELGISEKMIRLSVGVEHYRDIIFDIEQALEKV